MSHKKSTLTRKEFIKKSSAGILAVGTTISAPALLLNLRSLPAQVAPSFRTLGRTGLKVSTVGLGASRSMEPTILKTALDVGMNFVDTGRNYFNGQNEVMVGKVLRGLRNRVVVQSKVRVKIRAKGKGLKAPSVSGKIMATMERSLNESLKALGSDYIDVYLLHDVSSVEVINNETILEFFTKAKKSGKIRACGFSCHANQARMLKSVNETKFYDVLMLAFNHKGSFVHALYGHHRQWDQEAMLPQMQLAEKNGIGIVAMKTCSAGTYSPDKSIQPSLTESLRWVRKHSYVRTMAVAMGNVKEVREDALAMS